MPPASRFNSLYSRGHQKRTTITYKNYKRGIKNDKLQDSQNIKETEKLKEKEKKARGGGKTDSRC